MSNVNYERLLSVTTIARVLLDIRCPSRHRIRNDIRDQAFASMIARHDDLQCLRHFPLHAFSVWPGLVSNFVREATSTDNTTRCDSGRDVGSRLKYMDTPPSSIALTNCALPRRVCICWTALQ